MRRSNRILGVFVALALTASCSLDSGGGTDAQPAAGGAAAGGHAGEGGRPAGGGDATGGEAAGGDTGGTGQPEGGQAGTGGIPAEPPPFDDGDAVLAYVVQVVAACPAVSRSTVPGGWQVHALKDAACSLWTPPGWREAEDEVTKSFLADAQGSTGYVTITAQLPGTDWTIESLTQVIIDDLKGKYPDLEVLAAGTEPDPYGLGYQIRTVVLKYTNDGRPTVATVTTVHSACSMILNNCQLTGMGSWTPLAELTTWACILKQVDASLYCPGGGGNGECDDGECNATCVADGNESGHCVGDNCVCE